MARTGAGAIYSTLFSLAISMSQFFAAFARRSNYVSRVINRALSQISNQISITALILVTLHGIGDLSGSL